MTEGNFHQLVALLHCRGLHKVTPVPLFKFFSQGEPLPIPTEQPPSPPSTLSAFLPLLLRNISIYLLFIYHIGGILNLAITYLSVFLSFFPLSLSSHPLSLAPSSSVPASPSSPPILSFSSSSCASFFLPPSLVNSGARLLGFQS